MAANKFATMLHRNTNKLTLILVYAILEWILILLLLLNSLFSYLIIKFADYFGLKRPCLWCSRLDHILEPRKNKNSYRDLVCEAHANEISQLGYCSNHQKLAGSQDMCEDCSPSSSQPDCQEWSKKFAFFPWMKQIGMIQGGDEKVIENGEENLNCSCCGVSLNNNKFYPPCILIKPSWEVLDYTQKPNLTTEAGVDAQTEEGDGSDQSRSDFMADQHGDEEGVEENRGENSVSDVDEGFGIGRREDEAEENSTCSVCDYACKEIVANEDDKVDMVVEEQEPMKEANFNASMDDQPCDQTMIQASYNKGVSPEILPQHLEFYIDQDDCRLVLVDMIDSPTTPENQSHQNYNVKDQGNSDCQDVILDFDIHFETQAEPVVESWHSSGETVALLLSHESKEESKVAILDTKDLGEKGSSSVLLGEGGRENEANEPVAITQATQTSSHDDDNQSIVADIARGEIESDVHQATEDDIHMHNYEIDAEVSIGTEIPDQEPTDEIHLSQEFLHSYPCVQEDPSTSSANLHFCDDHVSGSKQAEEELLEFKTLSVETSERAKTNYFSLGSELNEIEEEKVPDTPTSMDSFHQLHNRLLLLERKESGAEESLDGSVVSDIEGGDGVQTVEKLKMVLRAERKALNALYAELEEERSASAVAAHQTMAMINRLQEEKAAMQMEALQYQRMMEEQSEYDQEAMQLLNELMVKREKEKQELEKELEICRKKVQEYEAKEKMMFLRRMKEGSTRSRTSSGPCSNAEDSDGLSIDLNDLTNEVKEGNGFYGHEESSNQNTPTDAVHYLEESLANFEEEKLSILDQLKELEEKLLTLNDEEEEQFEDIKPIEHFISENGNGYHESLDISEVNGVANGHSKEMNGNHHQDRKIMGTKAKRLLPLFDAIEPEAEDGVLNGNTEGYDSVTSQDSGIKFEQENKKLSIEEEVDHVYERLQALEADREFLKHCISSLRKGDKGLDLLQEILQHLRDLRSVEIRLRNTGEGVI